MSRTVIVTGGFSGALTVDVVDTLKQLTYATFRLALAPAGQDDPPPVDSPIWLAGTASQMPGSATVSAAVNGTTSVGYYNLAVDIVLDGTHQAEWVLEPGTKRRALVVVT